LLPGTSWNIWRALVLRFRSMGDCLSVAKGERPVPMQIGSKGYSSDDQLCLILCRLALADGNFLGFSLKKQSN